MQISNESLKKFLSGRIRLKPVLRRVEILNLLFYTYYGESLLIRDKSTCEFI